MAYPIRQFDPQTIFFITSRTIQSRFLMAPSDKTNELIGGILARAVRQCQVELFAYVFTSNHFHAMVRAPSPVAMSRFMQRLQSNIAVKVGRFVGWRGRFFARRYSAEPIVDEGAQVERLDYILSHGVKEGLVSRCQQWPGLSCAKALLEDVAITNLTMRHVWTSPIFIRLGARMRGPEGVPVGVIRRVSINNVVAAYASSRAASIISGIPGHPIEDIRLSNVRILYNGGDATGGAEGLRARQATAGSLRADDEEALHHP